MPYANSSFNDFVRAPFMMTANIPFGTMFLINNPPLWLCTWLVHPSYDCKYISLPLLRVSCTYTYSSFITGLRWCILYDDIVHRFVTFAPCCVSYSSVLSLIGASFMFCIASCSSPPQLRPMSSTFFIYYKVSSQLLFLTRQLIHITSSPSSGGFFLFDLLARMILFDLLLFVLTTIHCSSLRPFLSTIVVLYYVST